MIHGRLIEGGRGATAMEREPGASQTFRGKLKTIHVEAKNEARYHTIFGLLLLGSVLPHHPQSPPPLPRIDRPL